MLFLVKKQSLTEAEASVKLDRVGAIDPPVYFVKSKSQGRRIIAQAGLSQDDFVFVSVKRTK